MSRIVRVKWPIFFMVAGLVVGGTDAFSQGGQLPSRTVSAPRLVADWTSRLQNAESYLLAGEPKRARRVVDRVLEEMCDRVVTGDGIGSLFGLAMLLRSAVHAHLGEQREAIWDWYVAQGFEPALSEADLSRFGPEVEVLEEHRLNDGSRPPIDRLDSSIFRFPTRVAGQIEPPRSRRTPQPKLPQAIMATCTDGKVVISSVIGTDGRPHMPILTKSDGGLSTVLASFDAMKGWRFLPASVEGEPIAVWYNLTVNFDVRRCVGVPSLPE